MPTGVAWAIDRGELGTIDANGLFTPTGTLGGTATITAVYGAQTVTTTVTVSISTTQHGDPALDRRSARRGHRRLRRRRRRRPGRGAFARRRSTALGRARRRRTRPCRFSIPYDGTVWPQGLLAPLLQWNAGAHAFDSVYVHIKEKNFDYQGYFAANKTPFVNLPIPQAVVGRRDATRTAASRFAVSLVFAQGANGVRPLHRDVDDRAGDAPGHHLLQLVRHGARARTRTAIDHYGTAVRRRHARPSRPAPPRRRSSAGVDIAGAERRRHRLPRVPHRRRPTASRWSRRRRTRTRATTRTRVYVNLAERHDRRRGRRSPPRRTSRSRRSPRTAACSSRASGGMINGDSSTRSSTRVPGGHAASPASTGLPSRLPGGAAGVLARRQARRRSTSGAARSRRRDDARPATRSRSAMLDFDGDERVLEPARPLHAAAGGDAGRRARRSSRPATASSSSSSSSNPAAPGATRGTGTPASSGGSTSRPATAPPPRSSSTATRPAARLPADNATGAHTHTSAHDATLNYEPTVNPVASGGYAWVVFTSRRLYGNVAQLDPWTAAIRATTTWQRPASPTRSSGSPPSTSTRTPGTDPSHPAFYLPAQELLAGNSRGFWVVDPCQADGTTCQTGDQCCGGYCEPARRRASSARRQPPACSAQFDKCTTDSDCCGAAAGHHVHQRLLHRLAAAGEVERPDARSREEGRSPLAGRSVVSRGQAGLPWRAGRPSLESRRLSSRDADGASLDPTLVFHGDKAGLTREKVALRWGAQRSSLESQPVFRAEQTGPHASELRLAEARRGGLSRLKPGAASSEAGFSLGRSRVVPRVNLGLPWSEGPSTRERGPVRFREPSESLLATNPVFSRAKAGLIGRADEASLERRSILSRLRRIPVLWGEQAGLQGHDVFRAVKSTCPRGAREGGQGGKRVSSFESLESLESFETGRRGYGPASGPLQVRRPMPSWFTAAIVPAQVGSSQLFEFVVHIVA